MQENDVKKIIKIFIILGIIFCAISIVLPWRGMYMSFFGVSMGGDFYPWGGHSYINLPSSFISFTGAPESIDIWSIFYTTDLTTQDLGYSSIDSGNFSFISSYITDNTIIALAILTLVFLIITLALGIMALKKIKTCLSAGFTAIISIIFFVIIMTIFFSMDPTGIASNFVTYTIGFYFIIISVIIFFIAYGLNRILPSLINKTVDT